MTRSPSDPASPRERWASRLTLLLLILVGCRFLMMTLAPHDDPSEARYAEISRKMVETQDWITPQHAYGVPFWAKPPLSMWMSALGMEVFGVNEFGSRVFIFAAALGVLYLVIRFGWHEWSREAGLAAAVTLMGMPLFFYCSAAVMTDLALLAGTTLAMVSFRRAISGGAKRWGYLFFVGLAIGLLAKGPLTLVIAAPPIVVWLVAGGYWRRTWSHVPWFSGTLLMLLLAVPWYVLAERKTPGFIDYFILGEHWHRFVTKGWKGDLYGNAHAVSPGSIWMFCFLGVFPWCFGFLSVSFGRWRNFRAWAMESHGLGLYLLMWALWPVIFFTPAKNVIMTYPLPALPAMALLLGAAFESHLKGPFRRFHPLHPALIGACGVVVALAMAITLVFPSHSPKHSERELVRKYLSHREPGEPLVYFGRRKYSSEFYTGGQVVNTRSLDALTVYLDAPGTLYAAMDCKTYGELPFVIQRRLRSLAGCGKNPGLYQEIK